MIAVMFTTVISRFTAAEAPTALISVSGHSKANTTE